MSVKLHVRGLLASVCLFGVVAGGTVFAQDAVVDDVVVDQPAVDAPADVIDVVVEPAAVEEAAVVEELAAAAPPAKVALAVPAPGEETGYEEYDDEELAHQVRGLERDLVTLNGYIEDNYCPDDCDPEYLISVRDSYQNELDHVNEEIRRRLPVVVDTPDTTPAPAPTSAIDRRADATPPAGFCGALAAKGDRSDCGWSYRQSLKQ